MLTFTPSFKKKAGLTRVYEAQVNTTHGDWRKTGSLYAVQDVPAEQLEAAKVKDGEWFDDIKVDGNRVIININDMMLVD